MIRERINEIKDSTIEMTLSEKQRKSTKKKKRKEKRLRDLCINNKTHNIHILKVPERCEAEKKYLKKEWWLKTSQIW